MAAISPPLMSFLVLTLAALAFATPAHAEIDMRKQAWKPGNHEDVARLLVDTRLAERHGLDIATVRVESQRLPWMNGTLYRVSGGWEPDTLKLYFLSFRGQEFLELDGTSLPLLEATQHESFAVTHENVERYLWFFGYFVRGPEGPFLILDTSDRDTVNRWATRESEWDGRNNGVALSDLMVPLACRRDDASDTFACTATMLYANTLFAVEMQVTSGGMVAMVGDREITRNLLAGAHGRISIAEAGDRFRPRAADPLELFRKLESDDFSTPYYAFRRVFAGEIDAALTLYQASISGAVSVLRTCPDANRIPYFEALTSYTAPVISAFELAEFGDSTQLRGAFDRTLVADFSERFFLIMTSEIGEDVRSEYLAGALAAHDLDCGRTLMSFATSIAQYLGQR